jgi:hypothetical protein
LVSGLAVSTFCRRGCLSRQPFDLALDIISKSTDGSLGLARNACGTVFDIEFIH